ncbi:MAG: hypothetical protein KAY24_02605 [Candidatus Eisenbacteria sp.]|nr:hypothetical protein [Candidatus Eisenbacteria bacterium]
MPRAKTIYTSRDELVARYLHPRAKEYVCYASTVTIKDSGTNPVTIKLKFVGIPPFVAPMPPDEHTITAPTVVELFRKVQRWLKKHGYTFDAH